MIKPPLPKISTPYIDHEGQALRMWKPVFRTLSVRRLPNGNTVLAFSESGAADVLFEMAPDVTSDFVALLVGNQPAERGA